MCQPLGPNDENRELTEVEDESAERGLVCFFCGEGFGYAGQTPDVETLQAAVLHEKECPRNPYKQEIATLKERVLRMVRGDFAQICSYCGWEAPAGGASWEQLQAHIAECDEHPVKKLSDKVVDLERRLYLESECYNQQYLRREAAENALPKWIACAESLPDSDTTVMTFAPDSSEPIWPAYHDGEFWFDLMGDEIRDAPITHWMDFPEPPEASPPSPSSLARALGEGE